MAGQASDGILDPLVGTVAALANLSVAAGAGTALFAFALMVLSLEFLRESKGVFVPIARAAVLGALAFTAAVCLYGDFLLKPAKAAFERVSAELPSASKNTLLLTGLSVAGAGLSFYAGTRSNNAAALRAAKASAAKSALRLVSRSNHETPLRVSDLGRGLSLDIAGRLQLRALARNPKKPPNRAMKTAYRAHASPPRAQG